MTWILPHSLQVANLWIWIYKNTKVKECACDGGDKRDSCTTGLVCIWLDSVVLTRMRPSGVDSTELILKGYIRFKTFTNNGQCTCLSRCYRKDRTTAITAINEIVCCWSREIGQAVSNRLVLHDYSYFRFAKCILLTRRIS